VFLVVLSSVTAAGGTANGQKPSPQRSLSGKRDSVKMKFLACYSGKPSPLWAEMWLRPMCVNTEREGVLRRNFCGNPGARVFLLY